MKFIKNQNQIEAEQYDGSQSVIMGHEIDNKGRIFLTHDLYSTIYPGFWVIHDCFEGAQLMSDKSFKDLYVPVPENPKWEDD